jgi:NDP-sugar pyrophosphorylase family protein
MIIALAAGGKGSRMGSSWAKIPKCLIPDPVCGKPLLGHLLERVGAHCRMERVIVAGSSETDNGRKVVDYVERFPFSERPEITYLEGAHLGVAYAFYLTVREIAESGRPGPLLFTVSDTLAQSYSCMTKSVQAVTLGVIQHGDDARKKHTVIGTSRNGMIVFDHPQPEQHQLWSIAGIYQLEPAAIEHAYRLMRDVLTNEPENPAYFIWDKGKKAYKMTWVWQALQKQGLTVGIADLGSVAELNYPEHLVDLGRLVSIET